MTNITKGTIGAKNIAASLQAMIASAPAEVLHYLKTSNAKLRLGLGSEYLQFSENEILLGKNSNKLDSNGPKPISAEQAAIIWPRKIHFASIQKYWNEDIEGFAIAFAQEKVINDCFSDLSEDVRKHIEEAKIQIEVPMGTIELLAGKPAFADFSHEEMKDNLIKRLSQPGSIRDMELLKNALTKSIEEAVSKLNPVRNTASWLKQFVDAIPADLKAALIADKTPKKVNGLIWMTLDEQGITLLGYKYEDDQELNEFPSDEESFKRYYNNGYLGDSLDTTFSRFLKRFTASCMTIKAVEEVYSKVSIADKAVLIGTKGKIKSERNVEINYEFGIDDLLVNNEPISAGRLHNYLCWANNDQLIDIAANAGKLLSEAVNNQLLMMKPAKEQRRQIISGLSKMVSDADLALPEKVKTFERKLTELIKEILVNPELMLLFENREISIQCRSFSVSFAGGEENIRICPVGRAFDKFMDCDGIGRWDHPFSPMFQEMFMKPVEIAEVARQLALDEKNYSTNSLEEEWTKALRDIFSRLSI
jgi:hypothetical protein